MSARPERHRAHGLSTTILVAVLSLPAAPMAAQQPMNEWLNAKIDSMVAARINQRSNTNQTETPAGAGNSTSLVDQSSASDLFGIALNLAGLTGVSGSDDETTSATATVSAYALFAAANGLDPLSPGNYNRYSAWRRVSFTAGFDTDESEGAAGERVTILGGKLLLVNRRDATHSSHSASLARVRSSLQSAAQQFGQLTGLLTEFFYQRTASGLPAIFGVAFVEDPAAAGGQSARNEFANNVLDDAQAFQENVLDALSEADIAELDELIEGRLDSFANLSATSREVIESIRRAPQVSVGFLSKTRSTGADEYSAKLIIDYGAVRRVNLTANAAFEFLDNPSGDDSSGGSAALQFDWQLGPETLQGRGPVTFALAGNGSWMNRMSPVYQIQAKLTIPVLDGLELPVSLTYASSSELIDESEILGQIGFTVDAARLLGPLGF